MKRVYECENAKKPELAKTLEADPYAEDSFARIGYKIKDGSVIGHDAKRTYIYMNGTEEFFKNAEPKLNSIASRCKPEVEKDIIAKIEKEEEEAESGFGAIFG